MCGRFCVDIDIPIEELKTIIAEVDRRLKEITQPGDEQLKMPLGEIFPTNIVPTIISNKLNETLASPMQWGFSKFNGPGVIINARSETAFEKPMFRLPMMERRCLIPATNYFEWETQGKKKIKHALRDPDSQLIYMAGIYRYEADKLLPVFTILTRDAAPGIRYIHERMPVILPPDERKAWLSDTSDIMDVLLSAQDNIIAEAV